MRTVNLILFFGLILCSPSHSYQSKYSYYFCPDRTSASVCSGCGNSFGKIELEVNVVAQKVRILKYKGDRTVSDDVESNCDVLSKDSWKCKWQVQNGEDLILREYSFKNGKYFESFHGRAVGLAPVSTFHCAK